MFQRPQSEPTDHNRGESQNGKTQERAEGSQEKPQERQVGKTCTLEYERQEPRFGPGLLGLCGGPFGDSLGSQGLWFAVTLRIGTDLAQAYLTEPPKSNGS